jgi:hypothetical protein
MTLVTPLLVFFRASIASILTHIRQTLLLTSTTLLVIRVHRLMTPVSSTAHTFLSKWFVPLVRTPSSPRLASRPVMVSLLTHLLKEPTLVRVFLPRMPTATTEECVLPTLCDPFHISKSRGTERCPFFILNKNKK